MQRRQKQKNIERPASNIERSIERFSSVFMLQLPTEKLKIMWSQIVTSCLVARQYAPPPDYNPCHPSAFGETSPRVGAIRD